MKKLTPEEKRIWNKIRFYRVMHHDANLPGCQTCPHKEEAAWGRCYGRKKLTYYGILDRQVGTIVKLKPWFWATERTYTVCDTFFKTTK